MIDDFKKEKHESYGQISIRRSQVGGTGVNLCGSSIKHNNVIALSISPSVKDRGLNKDWFHTEGIPYIEVEMSYSQFAEAITSLNVGEGVPCTVAQINGKTIEYCPEDNKRQQFENEFK